MHTEEGHKKSIQINMLCQMTQLCVNCRNNFSEPRNGLLSEGQSWVSTFGQEIPGQTLIITAPIIRSM